VFRDKKIGDLELRCLINHNSPVSFARRIY
jgi:hypothetical protein